MRVLNRFSMIYMTFSSISMQMTNSSNFHICMPSDAKALQKRLGGIAVCPVVATTGQGVDELLEVLCDLAGEASPEPPEFWSELNAISEELARDLPATVPRFEVERALIDHDSDLAAEVATSILFQWTEQRFLWLGSGDLFKGRDSHSPSPR